MVALFTKTIIQLQVPCFGIRVPVTISTLNSVIWAAWLNFLRVRLYVFSGEKLMEFVLRYITLKFSLGLLMAAPEKGKVLRGQACWDGLCLLDFPSISLVTVDSSSLAIN